MTVIERLIKHLAKQVVETNQKLPETERYEELHSIESTERYIEEALEELFNEEFTEEELTVFINEFVDGEIKIRNNE
jgi:hypothetical protein